MKTKEMVLEAIDRAANELVPLAKEFGYEGGFKAVPRNLGLAIREKAIEITDGPFMAVYIDAMILGSLKRKL